MAALTSLASRPSNSRGQLFDHGGDGVVGASVALGLVGDGAGLGDPVGADLRDRGVDVVAVVDWRRRTRHRSGLPPAASTRSVLEVDRLRIASLANSRPSATTASVTLGAPSS